MSLLELIGLRKRKEIIFLEKVEDARNSLRKGHDMLFSPGTSTYLRVRSKRKSKSKRISRSKRISNSRRKSRSRRISKSL